MNHLNEGEIHAWLDGAVDATQSREIEAHVAECPTCAAAVAEARGFIAASSRILTALDEVPAGVTPKRAPVRAPAPVRQWRAAPWVTGIAAALMLAVGVTTWNRRAVEKDMPSTRAPSLVTQLVESLPPAVVQAPPMGAGASAPVAAPSTAPAEKRLRREALPKPRSSAELAAPQLRPIGTIAGVARTGEVRMRGAAGAGVAESREKKAENLAVTAMPAAPQASAQAADMIKLRRMSGEQRARPSAELEELAGCYRIANQDTTKLRKAAIPLEEIVVTGKAAASARAPTARAPAAVPAVPSAGEVIPLRPPMLRLDTALHPLGYAVRSATSDSIIGWWSEINRDSVRVDLLAAGRFNLARKNQITCPER
jgi:anti-sigma factor RsiW